MNLPRKMLRKARCPLLVAFFFSSAVAKDLYIFAGQSNMVGCTSGGQSIGKGPEFLSDMVTMLDDDSKADASALASLIGPYHMLRHCYDETGGVIRTEVDALLNLKSRGLTSKLTTPMNHATFQLPQYGPASAPLSISLVNGWYSGISYGPEYMFARTMQTEYCAATANNPMRIQKAARGGTQLYRDWSPTKPGRRWGELRSQIQNGPNDGTYQGFVWFQGENDCFHKSSDQSDDTFKTYEGNLTVLISEVRNLMHSHSFETRDAFPDATKIPVVIVEIGYWPVFNTRQHIKNAGRQVVAAQNTVATNDPCVGIIKTNDLARFYHFDPPSQLIIGDRIAHEMASLTSQCTQAAKATCQPSSEPNAVPSFDAGAVPSSGSPSRLSSEQPAQTQTSTQTASITFNNGLPSSGPSASRIPSLAPTIPSSIVPSFVPTEESEPSHMPGHRPPLEPSSLPSVGPSMTSSQPSSKPRSPPMASVGPSALPSKLSSNNANIFPSQQPTMRTSLPSSSPTVTVRRRRRRLRRHPVPLRLHRNPTSLSNLMNYSTEV